MSKKWKLELIAYGDSIRQELNSDYINGELGAMQYAVFVKTDTGEIRLVPINQVEP